jgi:hypothetical protein
VATANAYGSRGTVPCPRIGALVHYESTGVAGMEMAGQGMIQPQRLVVSLWKTGDGRF